MQLDEPQPRLGHRGNALSQVKLIAVKALVVAGGLAMLASAFVLSVVFLAIGLVVVLAGGGYLWWRTRGLRAEIRARMREQARPIADDDDVIEGEVIRTSEPAATPPDSNRIGRPSRR